MVEMIEREVGIDFGRMGADGSSKQSRSEKNRKAMLNLGMKPVTGVSRILFFISKPDVFKSPNSETYVIFGEAKIDDLGSQIQTRAAQKFKMPDMSSVMAKPDTSASTAGAPADEEEEEEEIDETGVEHRGIELVMTQAGVSRSKAVKALKTQDGDILSAIMELTTWLNSMFFLSSAIAFVLNNHDDLCTELNGQESSFPGTGMPLSDGLFISPET
ncbi:Nascent polypeptide-associated complex subunit alpha-like protein [Hibiscus syriacus]|uniref:Nascent polypeptide-associated complex subunit alpha-like protein n=1 Tax=Hibiscus syriacus TaxID=106335 RepID=A0A6A3BY08_HIBSY|nr:Nascent polypeptide-associated complex subunit alpha-like protein [Hibiscus syriacus]